MRATHGGRISSLYHQGSAPERPLCPGNTTAQHMDAWNMLGLSCSFLERKDRTNPTIRGMCASTPQVRQDGSVAKFDFWGKIQKSGIRNSTTYRLPNSRKSNFATEPFCEHGLDERLVEDRALGSVERAVLHPVDAGRDRIGNAADRMGMGGHGQVVAPGSLDDDRELLGRVHLLYLSA